MGISIGLVGLGSFGGCFAPLFKSHPLVDRIALCDAQPEKLKQFAEHPAYQSKLSKKDIYSSLDDICKADLDALVIITQPWLHAPQCIQAMKSGKHVYSAVPVISLPDGDEILEWSQKIIDATLKTGMQYMLGETTIYRPQTMFCRRMAAKGEFGDFVYAEGEYAHDVDHHHCSLREVQRSRTTGVVGAEWAKIKGKYDRRGVKTGPMYYPTHSVAGPLSVMKARPVKVSACGFRNRNNDPFFEEYDFSNIVAFFHMDNGASLRIAECREFSENIGCQGEDFRIFGTKASYSCCNWNDNGRTVPDGGLKENKNTKLTDVEMRDPLPREVADAFNMALNANAKPGDDFVPGGHGGSHPYLVHEFCSAVAENRTPEISAWDAATYMAMGVAAHKSSLLDGEIIKVHDFSRK